jgi:preprotein translocase subunit SecG
MSIQTYLPEDFGLLMKYPVLLIFLFLIIIVFMLITKKKRQKPEEFKQT